jgi:hypothetical protein
MDKREEEREEVLAVGQEPTTAHAPRHFVNVSSRPYAQKVLPPSRCISLTRIPRSSFSQIKFKFYNIKIILLESTTSEVSNDIYFEVYDLYYVDQNDDLGTRAGLIHRDGGSSTLL